MTASADGRIRRGAPGDLEAIRHIEDVAFEPSRRSSRGSLRRALSSPFQRVLVLEAGGHVAGYLILWPYRRTWRVYNLASDPAARNQGVGSALLAAAIDRARAAGASRLVLESRDEAHLLQFYQRRGFQAQRRLPNYYAEGEDAVRMELRLRSG